MIAGQDEVSFVGDGPLDILTFVEVHRLRDGGGEVDASLIAGFTLNDLNFGG